MGGLPCQRPAAITDDLERRKVRFMSSGRDGFIPLYQDCGRTKELPPIREAAFASLKAPLRPVQGPVDPTDDSEEHEASGR